MFLSGLQITNEDFGILDGWYCVVAEVIYSAVISEDEPSTCRMQAQVAQVQVFLGGLGTVGWFNRDFDACWLRIKGWPAARQASLILHLPASSHICSSLGNLAMMVCCLFQSLLQFPSQNMPGDAEMICARNVIAKSCQICQHHGSFLTCVLCTSPTGSSRDRSQSANESKMRVLRFRCVWPKRANGAVICLIHDRVSAIFFSNTDDEG